MASQRGQRGRGGERVGPGSASDLKGPAATSGGGSRRGPKGGGARQTEPGGWQPYMNGGAGIMARRTAFDPLFGDTSDKLRTFATNRPMRLLSMLPDVHPGVGLALWNALRLTCPRDGFRVKAVKPSKSADGTPEPDDAMTAALDAFWASLPPEIGGLNGLMTQLTIQGLFTGLMCVEAVPGARLRGIRRVWPVDSLSVWFARKERDADLTPYQRQVYVNWLEMVKAGDKRTKQNKALKLPAIGNGCYVELNPELFMWRAIDASVDDPYGRAPYATALSEVMADLAMMQDLRDAIHNAAWPRYEIGVSKTELHKVAVEVYKITNPVKAAEWVNARWSEVVDYVSNIGPGENIVHDSSGNVKSLQPGSFTGLEGVLNFLRSRIVQSLKTLPTLMGVGEGNTQFTSVEWTIYVEGLETLRAIVAELILWVANLHLRTLGSKSTATAEYTRIKTNDELVIANTESVRILNATNKEKLGYVTHDEASAEVTGHKAAAPAQPGVIEPLPAPAEGPTSSPGGDGSPTDRQTKNRPGGGVQGTRKNGNDGKKNVPQNPNSEGTTKEERNTRKSQPKAQSVDNSYAEALVMAAMQHARNK